MELTGRSGADLLAKESATTLDEIEGIARTHRVWRGTLVHRRKDGSTFQSSSVIVPLTDERGLVTHYVAVERDISDEVRLREQLIHTERLSAVGQLVSGVAHELNNPLQSVLGFTERLLEAEREPQTKRDLEQVRSEAIRAGKIVRNLLAFVRRSSSERFLAHLNDIVRTTLTLRSYEFGSANIRLEEHYADGLPVVEHGVPCGILTTADLILTLQCMLQLWLRLAQVLQHDSNWIEELDRIALMLDQMAAIMVRSGQHCVHSWFNAHHIQGAVRASLYFYNTQEEADLLVASLKKVRKVL